jgi:predicted nucleic acid-binding protein
MHRVIISDTSVLILFQKINKLDLLQGIYSEIITTPEVAEEYGDVLPGWIIIQSVSDRKYQEFLETQIDKGEASAIALAKDYTEVLLLLDDLKARKLATQLNMKYTGTLGIINRAKQLGLIERTKPLIDEILNTDFRISEKIIKEFLILNGEAEKE